MAHHAEQAFVQLMQVAVTLAITACANASEWLPPGLGAENIPIEFTTENGWTYDGRIELPAANSRNGYAVMMLGGGIGSPIDWAVPGVMTVDGKPTRDGDTIARALLEAGFVVMRWHSIRRGDPKHAADPVMMDAPSYPQTIEQAKKVYAAFRDKKVVPHDHIFLLGHSLGARRAAILIEVNPKTPGVVMLAGASLLPSDFDAARKLVSEAEDAWNKAPSADLQGDLARAGKEGMYGYIAARVDRDAQAWSKPFENTKDKHGYRWGVEVIAQEKTPTLSVVGSVDDRWLLESYMFTSCMRSHAHPDYTWKVYAGLGHQLGPEVLGPVEYKEMGVISESRTGPIDEQVVKDVVEWLKARVKP